MTIADRLEAASTVTVSASVLLVAVILQIVDIVYPAIGMGPVYVLLLGLVSWRLSRRAAVFAAVIAIVLNTRATIQTGIPTTTTITLLRVGLRCAVLAFVVATMWALRRAYDRERASARLDGMTGLLNRSSFEAAMVTMLSSTTMPVVVGVMDLDNFKSINDHHGHAVGDDTIRTAARAAVRGLAAYGFVGRMGGDEFAFIAALPEAGAGEQFAIGFHRTISDALISLPAPTTISMGAVIAPPGHRLDYDALLLRADGLLYAAKRNAKASVIVADVGAATVSPSAVQLVRRGDPAPLRDPQTRLVPVQA
jgi:diguanylate cyclase (GGDEF)-like protein